ncbi:MAG: hypothetical protein RLZZ602_2061, partial [Pseudomonadota bacterium]
MKICETTNMRVFQRSALTLALMAGVPLLQAQSDSEQSVEMNASNSDAPVVKEVLPLQELQTFADVFQQIRTGYVEEIDDSKLFEYAVRGMLEG